MNRWRKEEKKTKKQTKCWEKNAKRKNRVLVLVLADAFLYVIYITHSSFLLYISKFIRIVFFFSLSSSVLYYMYRCTDPYSMLIYIYGIEKTLGKFYVTRLFIRIFWRKNFPLFHSNFLRKQMLLFRFSMKNHFIFLFHLIFAFIYFSRTVLYPVSSSKRFWKFLLRL